MTTYNRSPAGVSRPNGNRSTVSWLTSALGVFERMSTVVSGAAWKDTHGIINGHTRHEPQRVVVGRPRLNRNVRHAGEISGVHAVGSRKPESSPAAAL